MPSVIKYYSDETLEIAKLTYFYCRGWADKKIVLEITLPIRGRPQFQMEAWATGNVAPK